jgi:PAS domain S-box-containing protein
MVSFLYGLLILLLGFCIMLLTYLVTRASPRRSHGSSVDLLSLPVAEIKSHEDAILLVGSGGRIVYSNAQAKTWFGNSGEMTNLERLVQRAQPGEVFLGLCSTEGQASFAIDGRLVEGVSYFVPSTALGNHNGHGNGDKTMLIRLSRPKIAVLHQKSAQSAQEPLSIFADLSKKISSDLRLEPTVRAIFESAEKLISADWMEITIVDSVNENLIPYLFVGAPGASRRLEKSPERYSKDHGFSGYLISTQKSLLIEDIDNFKKARPTFSRQRSPFSSYLGVPLSLQSEIIGTLELASYKTRNFTENDLQFLTLLAAPAAAALKNGLQFEEESKRVRELSGLTNLSKAMNNLTDVQDLFSTLVESISELFPVKILGFLLYRESHHILEAQPPFRGIPEQLLSLFRVEIPPSSPGEAVLLRQERIHAIKAVEDETLKVLGLEGMVVASGMQNTILMPLKTPTRFLGYIQIADRLDGLLFDQENIRLLEIVSLQSAAIIENALMVKESQSRAQRSETLRRVASLAGSSATLDEIMIHSLRELARLLRANAGLLYLLDEYLGDLYLHPASLGTSGSPPEIDLKRINMTDARFKDTVTSQMQPLFLADLPDGEELPSFYQLIFKNITVHSVLIVPFIVRGQGVGEMILTSQESNHFDPNDLTLVSTTASQLSVAIEKEALYGQTDASLQRRVVQLLALNRISRELSTTLDLSRLLQVVYEQVVQTTEADCGAIFLFEQAENALFHPRVSFHVGDSVTGSLTPIEQKVLRAGVPYIVRDYLSPDPNAPDTMPIPPHPNVRSSLIVPIAYQDYVAGLIHLHAHTPERFDATSQEIAQSLAVQAAIAIGNAQRYQEQQARSELLNRRVEAMTALLETTRFLRANQPIEESLETIAYGIQSATPFNIVMISVFNPKTKCLERKAGAGIPIDKFSELKSRTPAWESVLEILKPEYKKGRSYFVPENENIILPPEIVLEQVAIPSRGKSADNEKVWHSDDLLLIPLESSEGNPLGLVSVDAPRNNLRPDQPTIESLEIFASQAGLVIEAYEKISQLNEQAEILQSEALRDRQMLDEVQQQVALLQERDKIQSSSLISASQRLQRMYTGLNIADIVDQQIDRNGVLLTLAAKIKESLSMEIALVGELGEAGPRLLHVIGDLPQGVSPHTLLGQRNPLRTSLQTGQAIIALKVESIPEWKNSPMLNALGSKSFICQPILSSLSESSSGDALPNNVDAVILVIGHEELTNFDRADEQVLNLVARQATIALQNLHVITEANRRLQEMNLLLEFSRQLGTFDPEKILQTLVEGVLKVIPAAQAGMAALWAEEKASLVPIVALGYPDNEKILQIPYSAGESLPGRVFSNGQPLRQAEVLFAQDYNLKQEYLLLYRDATQGKLPVSALIVPLQTFDTKLGVLVLDNFREPNSFSEDDQVLVMALARQTALTLQNVNLYKATQARTAQLQTLTRVAGTITSSLQTEDLIRSLLNQVRSIVPYDTGILWLRQGEQMTVRAASGFDDREQREGLSVALEDSLLLREMANTNQPLCVSDVRQDARFPALLEHRYFSWLGVPLLSKGEMIGVIVIEKAEVNYFTADHIQALVTFAGQAAVALENASLYEESLHRAGELDERSQRLALLNRLSSQLIGSLDLERILSVLSQEMLQAIGGSIVSVALLNSQNNPEILIQEPLQSGVLPILLPENPVIAHLRESLGVFSTEDVRQETELGLLREFFESIGTKSLLIVPLISGSNLIGMTLIHQRESVRFSPDEVALAITINNQAAVAIQNAKLFQETERLIAETRLRSTELATLFDLGVQFTQVLDQNLLLNITFENLNHLIHPDAIVIAMMDTDEGMVAHIYENEKRLAPLFVKRSGTSFSEHVIQTSKPLLLMDTQDPEKPVQGVAAGDPCRSWLGVPLMVRGTPNGVISVQSNQPFAFGDPQLRLLSQIANQLSVALDNAQLFKTVQNYTAELEQRVSERTDQLAREHRRIQTLLSITTELSASLDLDMVLSRTLSVVNETIEAEHATILLIQPESPYLFLRASQGYTGSLPQTGLISKLKRNEGMAGWVINNRQSVLIEDLHSDNRWERRPDRTSLHRSAMIVPLLVGEEILGVMMVFHRSPNMFKSDQLDLIQAVAKQIAIAINNTQLYGLIRDQAERLGDMLRTQHIETSRSQAILEAVADGVLVTDARRMITLFNASAEKILGLSRVEVLGKSLEQFIGLFGDAAQSWVQTIRTWSDDPEAYSIGELYEAQINLDDRRVVSVHLSPVHLRTDFLGTVSIFRDITHEVEVDRLKSEFVATVSHELRTPMTSIKGYVEILLMGAAGQVSPQQAHFLEIVKSNTERLAILVNDLLDVSRIESGKVTLSLQPLDLRQLANDIIDQFKQRFDKENRPMEITCDIPMNLPLILGDPERIRQVMDNLVENAYQYTPVGGKIAIAMRQVGKEVQVDVRDNGIGIQPEEHSRIFERFYRGEDPLVLATSGTGLGLSIVKKLVEMHQGRIWFESEGIPGLGSIFSLTLPIYNFAQEEDRLLEDAKNVNLDKVRSLIQKEQDKSTLPATPADDELENSDASQNAQRGEQLPTQDPSNRNESQEEDWLLN